MAVYRDLHCQWCKATLGIDAAGDGKSHKMLRDAVQTEDGKFYCPACWDDLQRMKKAVNRHYKRD